MAIGSTSDVDPEQVCLVDDDQISEASGIAVSHRHEDAVWMHNDSGDTARLFLVGLNGKTRAIVTLNIDRPLDWEDMCSFESDGEKWLLIGDTGDNLRVRSKTERACELLLIREPEIKPDEVGPVNVRVDIVSRIQFQFPDGPEDCESLAVDTQSNEILLLTKCAPQKCQLFRLPLSTKAGQRKLTADPVASLAVPFATSMDVAPDNQSLVIVNMFSGALIRREKSESWTSACQKPITVLTLPAQPQCETVCFESSGGSVLVNSERTQQPLWRIKLPEPDSARK
ncbi:MAG: hypothetical protein U0936_22005 [Planctomycetaceae bacterium]